MNLGLLLIGAMLLVFTLVDLFYTTFSMKGGGPITTLTTRMLWSLLRFLSKIFKTDRLLNIAGMLIIGQTLLQWVLLIWSANFFIFYSTPRSIINGETKLPASVAEKLYVSGYTITTMGNGDFIGSTGGWKIYIAVASLIGLVVLTVSLSYLVQVLSLVTSKREFSRSVSAIATNPYRLLQHAWRNNSFELLNSMLAQWNNQVTSLTENHLSFPILHFYYSNKREKSMSVNLSILDDALSLIYSAVPERHWPNPLLLQATRNSIYSLLQTIRQDYFKPASTVPPVPALSFLQDQNIPLINREEALQNIAQQQERRLLLLGYLQNENRDWSVVYPDASF